MSGCMAWMFRTPARENTTRGILPFFCIPWHIFLGRIPIIIVHQKTSLLHESDSYLALSLRGTIRGSESLTP